MVDWAKKKSPSSLGIIIFAALLIEVLSFLQFSNTREQLREGSQRRAATELYAKALMISNTLTEAENTLQEHLWDIQANLPYPDNMFEVTRRLIMVNDEVQGSCIGFVPYYYPQKGRLFEPYAYKENGVIQVRQLGSDSHDYTLHPAFAEAVKDHQAKWSDPYEYQVVTTPDADEQDKIPSHHADGNDNGNGNDNQPTPNPSLKGRELAVKRFTTFTYPLFDSKGDLAAICGLDLDLTWFADTINAMHYFPSSFGLLLTHEGKLVVGVPADHPKASSMELAVSLINDSTVVRHEIAGGRVHVIDFKDKDNSKACVCYTSLQKDPHWIVAIVNYYDEIYKPVKMMRQRNMLLMLLGLLALIFIVNRFARNASRLQEAGIQNERIASELRIANNIQLSMLPKTYPPFPGRTDIDVYGTVAPAKEVGGDIFDFFLRDEKLFFCIGDVSGKGVPAALVMAMMCELFRLSARHTNNPARIIKIINEELCRNNSSNMFMTFFLGILDLPTGKLRYCNAGHDRPIVLDARSEPVSIPAIANLPIGIFNDFKFEEQEYQLPDNAMLFLYTDGLTEAKNNQNEMFRLSRIIEELTRQTQTELPAIETMLSNMTERLERFVGDAQQTDDLTMLGICYHRPANTDTLAKEIVLQNDIAQVPQMNDFVKEFVAGAGIEMKTARKIQLAVEEAVTNVMNYAYPKGAVEDIILCAKWNGKRLKFVITDSGAPFDPTSTSTADITLSAEERPIGGLGILLSRSLMDSVNYERIDGKNILTLRKKINS